MSFLDMESKLFFSTEPKTHAGLSKRIARSLFVILVAAGLTNAVCCARSLDSEQAATEESSQADQEAEPTAKSTTEVAGEQEQDRKSEERGENATRLAAENEELLKRVKEAESRASAKSKRDDAAKDRAEATLSRTRYFKARLRFTENRHAEALRLLKQIPRRHRNFEWYYLKNAHRQSRVWFRCGKKGVHNIAFRPNGSEFAIAARNAKIYVHDAATGYEDGTIRIQGHETQTVAWSPNGKLLASGRWGAINLFDVKSGKRVRKIGAWANEVAFASRSDKIYAAGKNGVTAWQVETGEQIWKASYEGSYFHAIAVSPDGTQVVAGDNKGQIFLLDAKTGKVQFQLKDHFVINWLEYSNDSSMLAVSTGWTTRWIKLINPLTGKEIRQIRTRGHWVNDLQFSPDDKMLLTAGYDSYVKLWDVETGSLIRSFSEHSSRVDAVCWNPDGSEFVSGDRQGKVRITKIEPEDRSIVFDDGAQVLAIAVRQSDGQVASGSGNSVIIRHANGAPLRSLPKAAKRVRDLAYSPDGKLLASALTDGTIDVWSPDTGEKIHVLKKHKGMVKGVAFTADGRNIVSGGLDKRVRVWSAESGKLLRTLKAHGDSVYSVDAGAEGNLFASAALDRKLLFWDAESGKKLREARLGNITKASPFASGFYKIAFSPDGSYVAAGTQGAPIFFYDAKTGKEITRFSGHKRDVRALAFSPDGSRLASGSPDQTVRIWDTETHEELCTLRGHTSTVEAVCFSADGSRLYSGSRDDTLRVWDATDQSHFIELDDVSP